MKFSPSLISLIALALTSTSIMAQPVATINATSADEAANFVMGEILRKVPKDRRTPNSNAPFLDYYEPGDFITIVCWSDVNTTPVDLCGLKDP
jgi:hypothetical protein